MSNHWIKPTDPTPLGNFSRMVCATPIADNTGGIDFNNTFCINNAWVFTTKASISLTDTNRNDPI